MTVPHLTVLELAYQSRDGVPLKSMPLPGPILNSDTDKGLENLHYSFLCNLHRKTFMWRAGLKHVKIILSRAAIFRGR